MHGQNLLAAHHNERMDYHERALKQRTGLCNTANSVGDGGGGGVVIVIPHNGRNDLPPGSVMVKPDMFGVSPGLVSDAGQEPQDDLGQPQHVSDRETEHGRGS